MAPLHRCPLDEPVTGPRRQEAESLTKPNSTLIRDGYWLQESRLDFLPLRRGPKKRSPSGCGSRDRELSPEEAYPPIRMKIFITGLRPRRFGKLLSMVLTVRQDGLDHGANAGQRRVVGNRSTE